MRWYTPAMQRILTVMVVTCAVVVAGYAFVSRSPGNVPPPVADAVTEEQSDQRVRYEGTVDADSALLRTEQGMRLALSSPALDLARYDGKRVDLIGTVPPGSSVVTVLGMRLLP